MTLALAHMLIGFPRHLSQHVGGFVMTQSPLCEVVPIEHAAMAKRTVIAWDKDDLNALGILKVDVLALGMLTCLRQGSCGSPTGRWSIRGLFSATWKRRAAAALR